jgi:hypothetical protein
VDRGKKEEVVEAKDFMKGQMLTVSHFTMRMNDPVGLIRGQVPNGIRPFTAHGAI